MRFTHAAVGAPAACESLQMRADWENSGLSHGDDPFCPDSPGSRAWRDLRVQPNWATRRSASQHRPMLRQTEQKPTCATTRTPKSTGP